MSEQDVRIVFVKSRGSRSGSGGGMGAAGDSRLTAGTAARNSSGCWHSD